MSKALSPSPVRRQRAWLVAGVAVVAWFALAEIACQAWYFAHESKLKKNPVPETGEQLIERLKAFAEKDDGFQIRVDDVGDAAREILKCSFGKTLSWATGSNVAAVSVIRWDDRSSAGGVESSHNPGMCLGAAGWTIGTRTQLGFEEYCGSGAEVTEWEVSRPNIQMLAYSAVFRRFSGAPTIERRTSRNDIRWGSVFAGRRDAPVLVMLVYISGEKTAARAKLDRIMRAALCTPEA
jgi:hypothetical protein